MSYDEYCWRYRQAIAEQAELPEEWRDERREELATRPIGSLFAAAYTEEGAIEMLADLGELLGNALPTDVEGARRILQAARDHAIEACIEQEECEGELAEWLVERTFHDQEAAHHIDVVEREMDRERDEDWMRRGAA